MGSEGSDIGGGSDLADDDGDGGGACCHTKEVVLVNEGAPLGSTWCPSNGGASGRQE